MHYTGLGGSAVPVGGRRAGDVAWASRSCACTARPSTRRSPAAPTTTRSTSGSHTDGSPLDGVDLRLVDDDGEDVAVGEPGEILSRGPGVLHGLHRPGADRRPRSTTTAGSAPATSASLDDDGYLRITDRKKDVIIRGGENVSAVEVEEVARCSSRASPRWRSSPAPDERLRRAGLRVRPRRSPAPAPRRPRRRSAPRWREAGLARAEVARGAAGGRRLPSHAVGQGAEGRAARPAAGGGRGRCRSGIRPADRTWPTSCSRPRRVGAPAPRPRASGRARGHPRVPSTGGAGADRVATRQNWRWLVVTDPETRAPRWPSIYRSVRRRLPGEDGGEGGRAGQTRRVYESAFDLAEILERVPVHVIPCIEASAIDLPRTWRPRRPTRRSSRRRGASMLALRSRGLGSVWTTLHLGAGARRRRAAGHPRGRHAGGDAAGGLHDRHRLQAGRRGRRSRTITYWETWGG